MTLFAPHPSQKSEKPLKMGYFGITSGFNTGQNCIFPTVILGGGGGSAKCEVMGFCLKLATSTKGLPLLRATEIFQNAPRGVTLDVHKCVFVHFWGMQTEIWGCFASKVMDLCMLT